MHSKYEACVAPGFEGSIDFSLCGSFDWVTAHLIKAHRLKSMLLLERRRCHTKHSPAGAFLHEDYRLQTVTLPAPGDLQDWLSDKLRSAP